MMHPVKCTHTLPSLQIPRSSLDFLLPLQDPNLLGLFMLEMISFGTQMHLVLLLACLFTLMATTLSFFFFKRDKVWRPFCPPCWCKCWRTCLFAFSVSSLFLPHSSPCTHRTYGLPCGIHSKPWFVLHQASSLP